MNEIIDQLGNLNKELEPLKVMVKNLEAKKKSLEEQLTKDPGIYLSGNFMLEVKPPRKTTIITNKPETWNRLDAVKPGLGWELVTFPITELKKYLNKTDQALLLNSVPNGNPSYKTTEVSK